MAKEANHSKCIKATVAADKRTEKVSNAFMKFTGSMQSYLEKVTDIIGNDKLSDAKKVEKIDILSGKMALAVDKVLPG